MERERTLALWCPDWPAVSAAADADLSPGEPVAVLHANRVVACTAVARAQGVRRGLRKREAQARCPGLHVAELDAARDARAFEPVVSAVEQLVPGVEILRPGLLAVAAHRAVRYFGGEHAVAEPLIDAVAAAGAECQVGIADALATAVVAAKRGRRVEPGDDGAFLAELPVGVLAEEPALAPPERADLVDLLRRMGIRSIGGFAALPRGDVASRFGADGTAAHRVARAEPQRPPAPRTVPAELAVQAACDPPIDRVDAAAFAGRRLAERLHTALAAAGAACTRLAIHAATSEGEEHHRVWRCAEPLTPAATADRVRWQMDGWLTGRGAARPTGPIVLLRLEPVELVAAGALQMGLFGGAGEALDRARRAVSRVQGLLGGDAVRFGVLSGGRGPSEQVTLRAWGDQAVPAHDPSAPWPGRLPAPAPVELCAEEAGLLDGAGGPVGVTGRGLFTAEPAVLVWRGRARPVTGWAGPWPVDEHWWDPAAGLRAARAQVLAEGVPAVLLLCRGGEWTVEGVYG
ncbi:DNA polymerase Y family protein [Tomitella fengzijianii]|uniref:DNA polymerase Y family protein n=1 Tax=Tomitella fengzijianii TaxID=2597660 RepID=A0A516X0U5_9ACTN|nr:DNA polymerase Y family protein [Tomitella fengzijianii]QDQ96709.1 DNA polymerase Y family protein [Tomitella fengzijianii]